MDKVSLLLGGTLALGFLLCGLGWLFGLGWFVQIGFAGISIGAVIILIRNLETRR